MHRSEPGALCHTRPPGPYATDQEFLKFKGFGSLSSIPWTFTFRRVPVPPSILETPGGGLLSSNSFLEVTIERTQDDLNSMPKSPPPYARSCDMCSHMATMPRAKGKRDKANGTPKDRIQDVTLSAVPDPHLTALEPILRKEASLADEESELREVPPPKDNHSPVCPQTTEPVVVTTISKSVPELGQLGEGTESKANGHKQGPPDANRKDAEEHVGPGIPEKSIVSEEQTIKEKISQENAGLG
uniref:Uncharacterized protein n=1 Tax=Sphaerodactylus townsendi TaxID=933632 RepID=A0ACB8F011_9SAUR